MSKEEQHIDKLFKDKLADRNFDGPPADFLADLNSRLDERESKRGFIWFFRFFFDMLLITLLLLGSFSSFSDENRSLVSINPESEKISDSKNDKKEAVGTSTAKQVEKEFSPDAEAKSTEKSNEKTTSEEKDNKTIVSTNQEDSPRAKQGVKFTKDDDTARSNEKKSLEEPAFVAGAKSSEKSDDKRNTDKENSGPTDSENQGDSPIAKKGVKNISTGNKNKTSRENKKEEPESNTDQIDRDFVLPNYLFPKIYASEFKEVKRRIEENAFPKMPADEPIGTPEAPIAKNPTPVLPSKNKSFELQLWGGAMKWNPNTFGTNDVYTAKLQDESSAKWTPSLGLAFHMNYKRFSFGTGLNYTNYKEDNNFEFKEVSSYDSTYIISTDSIVTYDSLNNQWDTTYVISYDSTTVTDTNTYINNIINQYEWIQIPLHFGYRFELNKWAVIPRVGVNIGLGIRNSQGNYPNENYDQMVNITPVKWNLNLHTSLEIRRSFGPWHAFSRFDYQRNLTSTLDAIIFERRYNGVGFNFGVGYSF